MLFGMHCQCNVKNIRLLAVATGSGDGVELKAVCASCLAGMDRLAAARTPATEKALCSPTLGKGGLPPTAPGLCMASGFPYQLPVAGSIAASRDTDGHISHAASPAANMAPPAASAAPAPTGGQDTMDANNMKVRFQDQPIFQTTNNTMTLHDHNCPNGVPHLAMVLC